MTGEVNKVNRGQLDNLTYNHEELVDIGIRIKNDYRCATLGPSTVKTIRRLRLNRRCHRGGGRRRSKHRGQSGSNKNMLAIFPITKRNTIEE